MGWANDVDRGGWCLEVSRKGPLGWRGILPSPRATGWVNLWAHCRSPGGRVPRVCVCGFQGEPSAPCDYPLTLPKRLDRCPLRLGKRGPEGGGLTNKGMGSKLPPGLVSSPVAVSDIITKPPRDGSRLEG